MTPSNTESLINWAQPNGAQISDDVRFEQIAKDNVGARSNSQNSSIKVPVKLILKLSDAVSGLDFDTTKLRETQKNVNTPLKLFLAKSRVPSSDSFYKPYIDSLPTAIEINSPYVWSPEDKQNLKGTNLGSSLRENLGFLVEEWWSALSALPETVPKPEAHFMSLKFYYEYKFYDNAQLYEYLTKDSSENWTSFPAYLWASMILKSRSFPSSLLKGSDHEIDELDFSQPDVAMLIPVVDLLNHNPQADVTWTASNGYFEFQSRNNSGPELYNNYGRKGNEELLLAYGFCLENNSADSVALKIKVPLELLPELQSHGVTLPKVSDYTTSVVSGEDMGSVENPEKSNYPEKSDSPEITKNSSSFEQYRDGLLFFITRDRVPEDLIKVFQWLVKNSWESNTISLRMQLSGLNHLRQAVESKASLIDVNHVKSEQNEKTIRTYLQSQRAILQAAVTEIKHQENAVLAANKSKIITLKNIYKKDVKFAQSLLVTMGVTSYSDILEQELMDQIWLLYLIRCYNKDSYKAEDAEDQYLPDWICQAFVKMDAETEMVAAEVVQFQALYENLILPMNKAVPEIYNRGKWTVRELIVSTKLLDTISFVRGKKQECLLVEKE